MKFVHRLLDQQHKRSNVVSLTVEPHINSTHLRPESRLIPGLLNKEYKRLNASSSCLKSTNKGETGKRMTLSLQSLNLHLCVFINGYRMNRNYTAGGCWRGGRSREGLDEAGERASVRDDSKEK